MSQCILLLHFFKDRELIGQTFLHLEFKPRLLLTLLDLLISARKAEDLHGTASLPDEDEDFRWLQRTLERVYKEDSYFLQNMLNTADGVRVIQIIPGWPFDEPTLPSP